MTGHSQIPQAYEWPVTIYLPCHPPGVKKGFVKGEGLRLLRTNSSEETFVENIRIFKLRLRARGYPNNLIDKTLSEVKFSDRKKALESQPKLKKMFKEPPIISHKRGISLRDILVRAKL